MIERNAGHWANPRTTAIGLAGFAFGVLALNQGDLSYELFSLALHHLQGEALPMFDDPAWAISIWFLLIPAISVSLVLALGIFGSSKSKVYPVYFVALLATLLVVIVGVTLTPILNYHLDSFSIQELVRLVLGEATLLGFSLLTIIIACGEKRDYLPQILVCFGAASAGGCQWYLQKIQPFGLNSDLWAPAIAILPLLFSLILFWQHRDYYQLHAAMPMKMSAFVRYLEVSPSLWKILVIQFLVASAFLCAQSIPRGSYTVEYYDGFWLTLSVALLALSRTLTRFSVTTAGLLLQTTKMSFAFVLGWVAFQHFGYPRISEWFGLIGNGGLYVTSLGVLAWYILTIDAENKTSDKPDYPKFLLMLLIVGEAPRTLLLIIIMMIGVDAPINEINDLTGFLATAFLLHFILLWTPGTLVPTSTTGR